MNRTITIYYCDGTIDEYKVKNIFLDKNWTEYSCIWFRTESDKCYSIRTKDIDSVEVEEGE